jgi:hypothetical protein
MCFRIKYISKSWNRFLEKIFKYQWQSILWAPSLSSYAYLPETILFLVFSPAESQFLSVVLAEQIKGAR